LEERRTSAAEFRVILVGASRCTMQANGRLRVHGIDRDGEALDAIVVIEDGVIVVTLFG